MFIKKLKIKSEVLKMADKKTVIRATEEEKAKKIEGTLQLRDFTLGDFLTDENVKKVKESSTAKTDKDIFLPINRCLPSLHLAIPTRPMHLTMPTKLSGKRFILVSGKKITTI